MVCIGACVVDILLAYVDPSVFSNDVTAIDSITYLPGGDALNESVVLARLGHNSKLMAAVGNDMWGQYIRDYVGSSGVDTSNIAISQTLPTTSTAVLVQPGGERSFVTADGTNTHYIPGSVNLKAIQEADAVCIGSFFTNHELDTHLPEILQLAKAGGAITAGDVLCREGLTLDNARDFLPYLDYVFPNYEEAVKLTGGKTDLFDIGQTILGYGVTTVVIKIGKRGCYVHTKEEQFVVPTYKKAVVVDTTGAGDNFAAGFVAALLEGKPLRDAAAFANATASVAVQYVGATGLKSRSEVLEMMEGGILHVEPNPTERT